MIPEKPLTQGQAFCLAKAKTVTVEQFDIARQILASECGDQREENETELLLQMVQILATNYAATVAMQKT